MEVNYRLDGVVKAAVASAWKDLEDYAHGRSAPPVVPVLVGGDDLTVYVEGQFAIPFAESYVRHYEQLTGEDELLSKLAVIANAPKQGPLTASAGVAIVGRNFPFHIASTWRRAWSRAGRSSARRRMRLPVRDRLPRPARRDGARPGGDVGRVQGPHAASLPGRPLRAGANRGSHPRPRPLRRVCRHGISGKKFSARSQSSMARNQTTPRRPPATRSRVPARTAS